MEIKESNLKAAYVAADESGKSLLRSLFPDANLGEDNRPVTERIKTFEDAVAALGEEHSFVVAYRTIEDIDECSGDIEAYLKLRIVVAALNEGWEPKFTEDEWRYVPVHFLYTDEELADKDEEWKRDRCLIPTGDYVTEYAGLASAYSRDAPSSPTAYIGSRLCLKSSDLATFCGKQFIELWADFWLVRR